MIQRRLPETMQRISVGGVLFGFKVGVTYIGVKTYKTKKNTTANFICRQQASPRV